MTNTATTESTGETRSFRLVQLLPAPVTLAALVVAGSHHLATAPLGVIAVIGTVATVCSVLLPAVTPAPLPSSMPAPREDSRVD